MGGRGSSLIGGRDGNMYIQQRPTPLDAMGEKGNSADANSVIAKINPNYNSEKAQVDGWRENCQSCVVAFEAQMRGYNVEAVPHKPGEAWYADGNGVEHNSMQCFMGTEEVVNPGLKEYIQAKKDYKAGKISKKELIRVWNEIGSVHGIKGQSFAVNSAHDVVAQMNKWGDKARAILAVRWKGTDIAHVVNVLKVDGQWRVADSQNGKYYTLDKIMSNTEKNWNALTRVDNLDFSGTTKLFVKKKG